MTRILVHFPERTFPSQYEVDVDDPLNREEVLLTIARLFAQNDDTSWDAKRVQQWCPDMWWTYGDMRYTLSGEAQVLEHETKGPVGDGQPAEQGTSAPPDDPFAGQEACVSCGTFHELGEPCPECGTPSSVEV